MHFTFEGGFQLALGAAELGDRLSQHFAQLGQFLGTEEHQRDQKDDDHLRYTYGTHLAASSI